jgi:hypothetical protein
MRLRYLGQTGQHCIPPLLALDSNQSSTSIRGDVDHESQTLRSFWKASSVNRNSFDVGHQSGRRFDIGVLEL